MTDRHILRFSFDGSVPAHEVENTLLLAVLAAEGLHGPSRVRLETQYCFDAEKRTCVIDVGSEVGRDVSNILAGFAIREFGEDAFTVCRAGAGPLEKEEVAA